MKTIPYYSLGARELAAANSIPLYLAARLNNMRTDLIHTRLDMKPANVPEYFAAEAGISAQIALLDELLIGNESQLSSLPLNLTE